MLESLADFQETILINEDYYPALMQDIYKAQTKIDLEVYIFESDALGNEIARALIGAAKRGVKVRVLVDGIGTPSWGGPMTLEMEAAGVATRIFHPLPLLLRHWQRAAHAPEGLWDKLIHSFAKINTRNHRKVCNIDNQIVYISSANISQCHLSTDQGGAGWRETTVRYANIDTSNIVLAFNAAWTHIPAAATFTKSFLQVYKDKIFQLNFSIYLRIRFYSSFFKKISGAKHRIWLMNAYFVPDRRFLKLLIRKKRQGCDVKIILASKTDVATVSLISNTFYLKLLKSGVEIYEYLPGVLHEKMMLVDDWYLVGSTNFNHRSFKHDLEINAIIQTEQAKKQLEKYMLADIKQSKLIQFSDLKSYPVWKRWLGNLLFFFRYYF